MFLYDQATATVSAFIALVTRRQIVIQQQSIN